MSVKIRVVADPNIDLDTFVMVSDALERPVAVSATVGSPPDFYPPHVLEILKQGTRESDLVMADWYEERGLERVAFIYRDDEPQLKVWRSIITMLAIEMPKVRPNDDLLMLVEAQAKAYIDQKKRIDATIEGYGFDITGLICDEKVASEWTGRDALRGFAVPEIKPREP